MNKNDLQQACCALIERKLGWGHSDDWQNQDFETLSAKIFEETQVVLSVSTLKRVWGKVKYDSLPSLTTLNTLAVFAGFESWREFRQRQLHQDDGEFSHAPGSDDMGLPETGAPAMPIDESQPAPDVSVESGAATRPVSEKRPPSDFQAANAHTHKAVSPRTKKAHPAWYLVPGILAVLILAGWMYNNKGPAAPKSSFSFSSEPLSNGIPNSVIFRYDAAAAGGDSVFIQQSWDPRRRFAVPPNGHTYTSMYYYPGYFRAKLIVGKEIVKEHDLLIPSDGWLAAADQKPVPVYFTRDEVRKDSALRVTAALLQNKNIPVQPQVPEIRIYNIGDMKGLRSDNFVFETELRSEYGQGSAICQKAAVLIHCENSIFLFPLSIPGCVAEMGLMLNDKAVSAKTADLSAFGCNMNEWVKLRCEVRDKKVRIWVNRKPAYADALTSEANNIVGVSYRFEGPGAVNAVKLARLDGTAVLEETFE
ncbi:hypothetical protein EGT74_16960 [Chitinophaga lutea]|uniref:Uncharacterized protein n=1 Tax=Chitinophaga lutea TaxID=2488634 RepID=A0A3N4QAF9_9BACT|nr:hypothetical protein [Chitinophaga lutea]RPE08724.1 hypothetical protein EGT74_16960 [Chitinophaga lutea]